MLADHADHAEHGGLAELLVTSYGLEAPVLHALCVEADRAVYRVADDGQQLVMRWFSPDRPLERVEGDAEVLRALRHLDVEQLIETTDGRGFATCRGRGVIVTEFIAGSSSPREPASLHRVAATLAATSCVRVDEASLVARRAGSLPAEDLAAAARWLEEVRDDVVGDLGEVFARLRRDLERTSDCETATPGLVHSDCHIGNVMLSSDGPVLFDWEGAGIGPLVSALGWLLFTSSVAGPAHSNDGVDATAVEAVMAGYTEVRSLGADELAVLSDAVRVRPLVVACRQLRDAVASGQVGAAHGWWSRYVEADAVARLAVGS